MRISFTSKLRSKLNAIIRQREDSGQMDASCLCATFTGNVSYIYIYT